MNDSSSLEQIKIENFVRVELSELYTYPLHNNKFCIDNTEFQVDFYNHENAIYGEIYAGIDELKPGHKRKILTDILKLLTIEKILQKPITKIFVFVHPLVEAKFKANNWYSKTFKLFDIEIKRVDISDEQLVLIRSIKKRQAEGLKQTTNPKSREV